MIHPFHLALPSADLASTRTFYTEVMGCRVGREASSWIDLDLFGHQLVFHHCGGETLGQYFNPVDEHQIPLPHFGVILKSADFDNLAARLQGQVEFIVAPYRRFKGTPGEQDTLFFLDNNGYAIEFKSFEDDRFIFEPFESDQ